jgi:hypothetical protein
MFKIITVCQVSTYIYIYMRQIMIYSNFCEKIHLHYKKNESAKTVIKLS